MSQTFTLPDVGEGLTEAEIVSWRVQVGDTVAVNDIVCEIETAKSLVELPIPFAGTVDELVAAEGDTVEVGQPLIRIRDAAGADDDAGDDAGGADGAARAAAEDESATRDSGAQDSEAQDAAAQDSAAPGAATQDPAAPGAATQGPAAPGAAAQPAAETSERPAADSPIVEDSDQQALVGSGPKADAAKHRPRLRPTELDLVEVSDLDLPTPAAPGAGLQAGDIAEMVAKASPPVRALAKRLGVAVWDLVGSGRNGQITRADVERQAQQRSGQGKAGRSRAAGAAAPGPHGGLPSQTGLLYDGPREEKVQVRGVRKATALNVSASASTVPHVSVFKEIDVSRTMDLRRRLRDQPEYQDVSVSPLLFAAKAIIWAVRRHPQVNASWHETHYTLRNYVNLGIAAATPRGLVVPVIHEAHTYSTLGLAAAITELTTDAREGRTTPAEMQGGTISITNIGPLGLDLGTPILPPGQAAIVVLGAVRTKPWVVEGQVAPRQVMTVGGSFDHRLIDGDLAGAFISDVAAVLEEPGLLLD